MSDHYLPKAAELRAELFAEYRSVQSGIRGTSLRQLIMGSATANYDTGNPDLRKEADALLVSHGIDLDDPDMAPARSRWPSLVAKPETEGEQMQLT